MLLAAAAAPPSADGAQQARIPHRVWPAAAAAFTPPEPAGQASTASPSAALIPG